MNLRQFNSGTPATKGWLNPVFGTINCDTINAVNTPPINTTEIIKTTNTTASTDTLTGALQVSGGAGIGGAVNVGGLITATGSISVPGNKKITIGNGTANTFIRATTSTTDDRRIRIQNASQVPYVEITQPNAPETTGTPCSTFVLNKNTAGAGGAQLNYYYNGTATGVPNAGANLNTLCVAHTGSACQADFFLDGSFHNQGLKYNQGDKAGVGNNGLVIEDTTASVDSTTGAVQVAGGLGVAGDVNIGGTLNGLSAAGGVFAMISNATVANTVTETSLFGTLAGANDVLPNTFAVGDSFILDGGGVMSCLNNATISIKVYGGATGTVLLGAIPTITVPTSTGKWWGISCYLTIRSIGGPGVGAISTRAVYEQNVDSQNGLIGQSFHTINNTTFDTTVDNVLRVTATWGVASASNTITAAQFTLFKSY